MPRSPDQASTCDALGGRMWRPFRPPSKTAPRKHIFIQTDLNGRPCLIQSCRLFSFLSLTLNIHIKRLSNLQRSRVNAVAVNRVIFSHVLLLLMFTEAPSCRRKLIKSFTKKYDSTAKQHLATLSDLSDRKLISYTVFSSFITC